jgi:hypothetical protein
MKQRTIASEHKPRRVYRFSELQKALSADYGGVDALTPFQKILLTQACVSASVTEF